MNIKTCRDCFYETVCPNKNKYDDVLDVSGYCPNFKNKAGLAEVVHCKDCEHWGGVVFGNVCRRFSGSYMRNETKETDFCSYGKRKGGEQND